MEEVGDLPMPHKSLVVKARVDPNNCAVEQAQELVVAIEKGQG